MADRRTFSFTVRLYPHIRAAIERAAKDDMRSSSSLVDKVMTQWLKEHGYLDKPEPPP